MPRRSTADAASPRPSPATTAQRLRSLLKACRDTMRKDKGLNGDLDRLPMLTWIMFLKFLDDMERIRKDEALLDGRRYRETIAAPYRWRDWNPENHSGSDDGLHNAMTGDVLISFIGQDEAQRPDGTRGQGLFAYLRGLQGGSDRADRRDVVATVFKETVNRMQSGYLLRDVLDHVNGIHFSSSEEIHTLGHFYESMLREMRDAAGDAGEFYTPRPLIRMIVRALDPQPGEIVLDPAAGTGGFLVEAYEHLRPLSRTVQDIELLQRSTITGIEAKPLPYLLCQMNLVLHGIDAPLIDPLNALRFRVSEIGDRDRVDIVMTNPPFGGEEEKGVQRNFPQDKQTAETALLFLQFIMRKLRRPPHPGRAAVIVPNGTLAGAGVADRIKRELMESFNLHTILRLPGGVFAPYTDIPTNVLFFDRTGPTTATWFYAHPLPPGRKTYTKTNALTLEELQPFLSWWSARTETDVAWRIPVNELIAGDTNGAVRVDLDRRNPRAAVRDDEESPDALLSRLEDSNREIGIIVRELRGLIEAW